MTNDLRALVEKWQKEDKAGPFNGDRAQRTDELRAALDAQAGGWRTMESAPRHGLLLTFHPRFGQRILFPDSHRPGWFMDPVSALVTQSVTHWMPLPAGPVEGGA